MTRRSSRLRSRGAKGLALAMAVGVLASMRFVDSYRLQVTRQEVRLPNLPKALDGFAIAQMTDFHRSVGVREDFLAEAVALCNAQHPDVVVLTGDFVSRDAGKAPSCARALGKLKAPDGVFAVLGNHDYWTDAGKVTEALEAQGIRVLTNRNRQLRDGLWLVGLDDLWAGKPDLDEAFEGIGEDQAVVVLSHNPRGLDLVKKRPCLVLSGHTHGGQVRIPLIPPIKVPDLRGTPYVSGWYETGRARMYINRGIGMVNPRIRIGCPPEVAVFVLRAE